MLTKGSGRLISASYFCYFSTVFMGVKLKAFLQFVFFQLPNIDIKTCWGVPAHIRHYNKYPETDFRASRYTQRGLQVYSQHFMALMAFCWALKNENHVKHSSGIVHDSVHLINETFEGFLSWNIETINSILQTKLNFCSK